MQVAIRILVLVERSQRTAYLHFIDQLLVLGVTACAPVNSVRLRVAGDLVYPLLEGRKACCHWNFSKFGLLRK